MLFKSLSATTICCVLVIPATAQIENLTNWDLYTDSPGATASQLNAMTGTADPNLAQLNFIDSVPQNQGFDIGYGSVNANTIDDATSGYYFSTTEDFTVRMQFTLDLANPDGLVGIGLGIGEDRAGTNSVGVGFAVGHSGTFGTIPGYAGALTDGLGRTQSLLLSVAPAASYSGSLTVSYDADTGNVTVGAAEGLGVSDPLAPTNSTTFIASEFANWNGDDKLLVSFFLRSDALGLPPIGSWTGGAANADFFDFTVIEGTPIEVPEPTSLALLGLGLSLIARRRC
ncbi:MAG: PEP-CTERM sorting domain-containing protein [Planctomycetota bacterium]